MFTGIAIHFWARTGKEPKPSLGALGSSQDSAKDSKVWTITVKISLTLWVISATENLEKIMAWDINFKSQLQIKLNGMVLPTSISDGTKNVWRERKSIPGNSNSQSDLRTNQKRLDTKSLSSPLRNLSTESEVIKFMALLWPYCNKYSFCIDINYFYTLFLIKLYLQANSI
jgi:hypothetical protein